MGLKGELRRSIVSKSSMLFAAWRLREEVKLMHCWILPDCHACMLDSTTSRGVSVGDGAVASASNTARHRAWPFQIPRHASEAPTNAAAASMQGTVRSSVHRGFLLPGAPPAPADPQQRRGVGHLWQRSRTSHGASEQAMGMSITGALPPAFEHGFSHFRPAADLAYYVSTPCARRLIVLTSWRSRRTHG